MDLRSTVLVVGGSLCAFKLFNKIVRYLPTPERACEKKWKWRNTLTSLAHSSLTGAWAVICLYHQPQMLEDLISSHSLLSHSLVAVSTGYFIHDFLDVGFNLPLKQTWEVLLHHSTAAEVLTSFTSSRSVIITPVFVTIVSYMNFIPDPVISCFSLAVTSRLYLGFAVVSLLMEINSVFLHIRQLLLLSGWRNKTTAAGSSVTYSLISWLNIGTLLVFRVFTTGWMIRWLAAHSEHMPLFVFMMGAVGTSLISIMNAVLFYRLFRADFLINH